MSDEQAQPLDLDDIEWGARRGVPILHADETLALVAEVRALRAEQARLARDLAAARSALAVAEDIVAIARRWADAETPSMAIRAAMDLRAALGQEQ